MHCILGELRAEGLRGCEPRGPCAYEVRCRLSAVCSAAQTVRDGGRPLPVAGQRPASGSPAGRPQQSGFRRTLGTSAQGARPRPWPLRECGSLPWELLAGACAAGAEKSSR